jgi:hypothetical protein
LGQGCDENTLAIVHNRSVEHSSKPTAEKAERYRIDYNFVPLQKQEGGCAGDMNTSTINTCGIRKTYESLMRFFAED